MSQVSENLQVILGNIAAASLKAGRDWRDISLVAVSKRVPVAVLQEAVAAGVRIFGENYLQEALDKIAVLPQPLAWHFIGRIQSNKTREIAENFQVVETVDRVKVAFALEKHLGVLKKQMQIYLQVNIGRESQKAGVLPEDLGDLIEAVSQCAHLRVAGLMAMPPYSPDPEETRPYFRQMKDLAEVLEGKNLPGLTGKLGLSMGMSGDYQVAIEEGATVVRVGTALFGERLY